MTSSGEISLKSEDGERWRKMGGKTLLPVGDAQPRFVFLLLPDTDDPQLFFLEKYSQRLRFILLS